MSTRRCVPVIGIVGGIGSGKSSVARRVAERLPVVVIDGDAVGHEVLTLPRIKEQIRAAFGECVFNSQGEVDRAAVGRRVFGPQPDQRHARDQLERIVHPEIRSEFARRIAAARWSGDCQAVVLDAAVLLESGWNDLCDTIVFVEVPEDARRRRVIEHRGWSDEQFLRRQASQFPPDGKQALSHATIDNSGSLDRAAEQLEEIIRQSSCP
ncbi:MAG TPA: dephospho-CoA kinase [Planctomycetaceae bacterium]|nr:dephospho-CoA kinase [Planctomycetaceae bacterium]